MTVCKNVDHHRNCSNFWKRFIFCSQHNLTSLVKSCFLQNIHLYSDVLLRWKYCSCTGNFLSERQNSSLLESTAGCLSGKLAKLCSIADWAKSKEESFCCFFNYFFDLLFRQPLSWESSRLLICFWYCQWFDFNDMNLISPSRHDITSGPARNDKRTAKPKHYWFPIV